MWVEKRDTNDREWLVNEGAPKLLDLAHELREERERKSQLKGKVTVCMREKGEMGSRMSRRQRGEE